MIAIKLSNNKNKRFEADIIDKMGKSRKIYFGAKNGSTFIDHGDDTIKKNYIARHSKLNEDWKNPYSAGALSRYILWEKQTLAEAIKNYQKLFNVKVIYVK